MTTVYRTKKSIGKKYGFKVSDHLERESERVERVAKESSSGNYEGESVVKQSLKPVTKRGA